MGEREAFLLSSIEEYGKFIAFCIDNDICVYRSYWDDREKGKRCYSIDWTDKRCYYALRSYYEQVGIPVVLPVFVLDQFGEFKLYQKPAKPE